MENLPVATINRVGILLEISFIGIYRFALQLVLPVLALFGLTAALSSFVAHTHHTRKVFVGSVGLVASISMYSSPMVAAKRVITTKSVEFMPFYLSLFSFLSSALWMIYWLLGRDFFIASPNFIGVLMGMLHLLLYCIYRRGDGAAAEAELRVHGAAAGQEKGLKAAVPRCSRRRQLRAVGSIKMSEIKITCDFLYLSLRPSPTAQANTSLDFPSPRRMNRKLGSWAVRPLSSDPPCCNVTNP
ncbi:unnamed protein product [Miscanthus lutarioriparius]|uniref:Bidirectional sugar transporter SWEET n=1 Tax=Miscanthus lutarioriparius TaxID=422564 RepID=A0A811SPX4_9POAL|nr:unnamed protein product [Miscanthus lutarioriparius]